MNTRFATRWVVALTGIGSLMAALDTVVVVTALPSIRASLGASVDRLQWTVNQLGGAFGVVVAVAVFAAAGASGSASSFFDGLALAIGVMAALSANGALAASTLPNAAGELIDAVPVPQEAG